MENEGKMKGRKQKREKKEREKERDKVEEMEVVEGGSEHSSDGEKEKDTSTSTGTSGGGGGGEDEKREGKESKEKERDRDKEKEESVPAATPVAAPVTPTTVALARDKKTPSRSKSRIKDLESLVTSLREQRREMMEDIELYKLDVAGFKKDIARRDALLAEQAHTLKSYPEEIEALRASHSRLLAEISRCRTEANGIVAERDKEIQRLEKVVGGLKHSISTNTRIEEAVGDEVFREMWSRIGWEVMNWCLANGAAKGGVINVESLRDDVRKELQTGIPEYEKLILGGHRVHVVQALLARLLIREIFSDWCFGITEEQNSVLCALEKEFTTSSLQPAINTWRSSTSILLRTSLLTTPTTTLTSKITSITSTIFSGITPFFPTPPLQTSKILPGIVEQTIRLSLHMQTQRAQFRIFPSLLSPSPPAAAEDQDNGDELDIEGEIIWNNEDMEELSGEDESELEGAKVLVVAWPGIEKWGDEMGECCHIRNCVVRARVVCDVD